MFVVFRTTTNGNLFLRGSKNKKPTSFFSKKRTARLKLSRIGNLIHCFNWRGEMICSHGSNHSRGVLVLIHQQLQFELKNSIIDDKGRFILLEVLVQESPFVLLNLYTLPQNSAINQFSSMKFSVFCKQLISIQNAESSWGEILMFIWTLS